MFTHPDRIGQLAREHHHQMLAQASQRQLRHQHTRPAATTRIIRRLAALIAGSPARCPRKRRAPSGPPGRTRSANQLAGLRFQAAATNGKGTLSTRAAVSSPGLRAAAQDPPAAGNPGTSKEPEYPLCAALPAEDLAYLSTQNGGYSRGCAKTQVALHDGHPVSRRSRLAEFTVRLTSGVVTVLAVPAALDPVRGRRVRADEALRIGARSSKPQLSAASMRIGAKRREAESR